MARQHPRHVINNWADSELPIPMRVFVLAKNQVRKAVTLSSCCGNYGEPGC